jgi:ribosomal protein S18 acetylase RimI-like enzyme
MMIENLNVTLRYDVRLADSAVIGRMVAATNYFTPAETEIAVELVDERLAKGAAAGYEFVIAEINGGMVGYACYGEIPCTVGSYDLYWIVVDPHRQRLGIGQQLMSEVESAVAAIGGRGIYIDTSGRPDYARTQRFYERCGYQPVARLADFYAPDDPKVIYYRAL